MSRLEVRRNRILREVERGLAEARQIEDEASRAREEATQTRRVLERTQRALNEIRVDTGRSATLDSRRIAGPAAIEAVEGALRGLGRTTQAEITKASGRNSGTVTHAMRILEASGKAMRTGRRFRGSEEWAWTGDTVPEEVAGAA